mgnify:CR=1 FL=1
MQRCIMRGPGPDWIISINTRGCKNGIRQLSDCTILRLTREHLLRLREVVQRALADAGCGLRDLDRIAVTQGEQMLGVLALEVVLACPYTTTLRVRQEHSLPWLRVPHLEVRVYHDARMAEVVGAAHARRLRPSFPYPNAAMHQPDEKNQLNLFLGEWLSHCMAAGHELAEVRR